jgi:hypothetical protein
MFNRIIFAIPVFVMCMANIVYAQGSEIHGGTIVDKLVPGGTLAVVVLYIVFDFLSKWKTRGTQEDVLTKLLEQNKTQDEKFEKILEKINILEKQLFTGADGNKSIITEVALLRQDIDRLEKAMVDIERDLKTMMSNHPSLWAAKMMDSKNRDKGS